MVFILSILLGCAKEATKIIAKTDEQVFNEKLETLAMSKSPFSIPMKEIAPFDWDVVCQVHSYAAHKEIFENEYPQYHFEEFSEEAQIFFNSYDGTTGFLFIKNQSNLVFRTNRYKFSGDVHFRNNHPNRVKELINPKNEGYCFSRQEAILQGIDSTLLILQKKRGAK